MSFLSAEGLVKKYQGKAVVDGVSLHVDEGEVVGLLGPNGAGKTTCFYMIMGLIPVDAGSIGLGGRDLTSSPMHVRARHGLGYLAQEPSIFRRLNVEENILAVLEIGLKKMQKRERQERCDELLAEFGISHLRRNLAISLSGGERRRLEIARCLATSPSIILLDEPFAGVDPISVADIQQIVENLAKTGIAILITDHNVRETLGICQRAYIVSEGAVLAQGTPEEILSHDEVRSTYLGENFRL
ncbi:LPS export ABC transporter ATP-binding protein [Thiolapillus sp.]|uniref:LPS export ABC transporter ATP-binding protein n=1 Tax=Thiolapillus sp. TaxID=2017437 RepID=UPI003AF5E0F2